MKIGPIINNNQVSFRANMTNEVARGLHASLKWTQQAYGENSKTTKSLLKNIGTILDICPKSTIEIGKTADNPSFYDFIIKENGIARNAGCKAHGEEELFFDSGYNNIQKLAGALVDKAHKKSVILLAELKASL